MRARFRMPFVSWLLINRLRQTLQYYMEYHQSVLLYQHLSLPCACPIVILSNSKFNEICLPYRNWSNHKAILQIERRLCCLGMCKIALWLDRYNWRYKQMYFDKIWNLIEIPLVGWALVIFYTVRIWDLNKMAYVLYTAFSNTFSWKKFPEFNKNFIAICSSLSHQVINSSFMFSMFYTLRVNFCFLNRLI